MAASLDLCWAISPIEVVSLRNRNQLEQCRCLHWMVFGQESTPTPMVADQTYTDQLEIEICSALVPGNRLLFDGCEERFRHADFAAIASAAHTLRNFECRGMHGLPCGGFQIEIRAVMNSV